MSYLIKVQNAAMQREKVGSKQEQISFLGWTKVCSAKIQSLSAKVLLWVLFIKGLDWSGINVGVHLLSFEKIWRKKKEKWSQCFDWCKNELNFWS